MRSKFFWRWGLNEVAFRESQDEPANRAALVIDANDLLSHEPGSKQRQAAVDKSMFWIATEWHTWLGAVQFT